MIQIKQKAVIEALENFTPKAGRVYTSTRNYDYGPERRENVSMLSPWVRLRSLPEWEICHRVLQHHSYSSASKFIEEVCWRTYWKGWLELRPSVWQQYLDELSSVDKSLEVFPLYQKLIEGKSGIECMDIWTHELKETGYLHNHARMWYASIWIHTLQLPWVLGADFFLQHLLDGDAASNTLSWRWVAGLHTKGKTYLARAENIQKYTDGRISPGIQLATEPADLLSCSKLSPKPEPLKFLPPIEKCTRTGLLLTEDDSSASQWLGKQVGPYKLAGMLPEKTYQQHQISEKVTKFRKIALHEALGNEGTYCTSIENVVKWAQMTELDQIVMAHPFVGTWNSVFTPLKCALKDQGIRLNTVRHKWDEILLPKATAGFFRFKKAIPSTLEDLGYNTVKQ